MTTKQQKIRIGIFAVIAGVLLGIVLVVFAGLHFWQSRDRYYIVFDESVFGLQKGADVHLNGIRVGSVAEIRIAPADMGKVRVAIDINEGTPVRGDTRAILQLAGLTGLKVIDLRGGSSAAPRLAAGGVIPVGKSTLDQLEARALAMADETAEILARAKDIVKRADTIVTNLTELTEPSQLGEVISQSRAAARNLAQLSASMKSLVDENRTGLRKSVESIELAARRLAEMADGTQVKAAVADLRDASRNFKAFAREVRQKPSRLLISTPEADRKMP